eukprot:TRINITY_DN48200_c0_g1_i1.p2 TRINITY_DN48200_c0_g1~~TRINITY_DN48200_c0_g1_i1.p2  ORF type:complete len:252 (-),score=74.03 TRINITY_DN48200_c0_g1_i1:160-915(-)
MAAITHALRDLGLEPGCSEKDVTSAFRRLAKQSHPDKGGSKETFQRINAAYETLTKDGGLEKAAPRSDAEQPRSRADDEKDRRAAAEFAAERERKERAWAQARRDSASAQAERAAAAKAKEARRRERPVQGAERPFGLAGESASRKRKRQQEEEEQRYSEEWKRWRQEQAELKAQQQEQLARRKAKWAAQHDAHISGVSLSLAFLLAKARAVEKAAAAKAATERRKDTEPKAPPLARCLQQKRYVGRRQAG